MRRVRASAPICPRCNGYVPNNENPGAYPGALSRVDNKTEICSKCGTDEAMEEFLSGRLTPVTEWAATKEFAL